MEIIGILKSLGLGIFIGIIFTFLKLPLPAPNSIEGIMGVVGLFLGLVLAKFFMKS